MSANESVGYIEQHFESSFKCCSEATTKIAGFF
jgi:hypothetical protein